MSLAKYAEDNERLNDERRYYREYREAQNRSVVSSIGRDYRSTTERKDWSSSIPTQRRPYDRR